jgi:predicted dehydrogenase
MSADGKIGWGVLGACGIAKRRTIPEGIMAASNAKLVAVMDVDQAGAQEAATKFGAKFCATEKELLRTPDIQAIYVATPNYLHKKLVIAAAKARRHVLCEKPLALKSRDILKMIAACKKANVLLGVGFMMRFNVYHRRIQEMLRSGALGTPVMARGQMTCWYPPIPGAWRQDPELGGGGALTDMGSHVVDLLEMFFGRTKKITARAFNRAHSYPVEDTCIALLEFENGAAGVVDVSFAIPDEASEFVLEVYGSRGAVKGKYSLGQGPGGDLRQCILGAGKGYDAQQQVQEKTGYQPMTLEPKNTYQSEIEAFSQAILEGRPAPVPAEDGLWSHLVMEAAYKSARTGKTIAPRMKS